MSELPENLHYTAEHEWLAEGDPATIGITAHAAEELGEIVFVELPTVGTAVTAVNEALVSAPETVGADPYGEGWLFRIKVTETGEMLDAAGYAALIA